MKNTLLNIVVVIVIVVAPLQLSQSQDRTSTRTDTLSAIQLSTEYEFEQATDLSSDNLGNLYVVDRGAHTIVKFPEGKKDAVVYGGPGSKGGQFYDPVRMDPTTGFLFVVADAGNARVQRLGSEFVYLESLSGTNANSGAIVHQFGIDDQASFDEIYPVAVTTSSDGSIYALDSTSTSLLRWNSNRQLAGVHSLAEQTDIQSIPRDIVSLGDQLFVLDAGRSRVVVYDRFGNRLGGIGPELTNPRSIGRLGQNVAVLDDGRLLVITEKGNVKQELVLPVNLSAVDFSVVGKKIYLLTPKALYAASVAGAARSE